MKVKDATLQENGQLRDDLVKARLENQVLYQTVFCKFIAINKVTIPPTFYISFQTLQLKLDEANEEIEDLQKKVQVHIADISRTEDLLSAKVESFKQRRVLKQTTSMSCVVCS